MAEPDHLVGVEDEAPLANRSRRGAPWGLSRPPTSYRLGGHSRSSLLWAPAAGGGAAGPRTRRSCGRCPEGDSKRPGPAAWGKNFMRKAPVETVHNAEHHAAEPRAGPNRAATLVLRPRPRVSLREAQWAPHIHQSSLAEAPHDVGRGGDIRSVRDDERRAAPAAVGEDAVDDGRRFAVQVRLDLVEQQQPRGAADRPGDGGAARPARR